MGEWDYLDDYYYLIISDGSKEFQIELHHWDIDGNWVKSIELDGKTYFTEFKDLYDDKIEDLLNQIDDLEYNVWDFGVGVKDDSWVEISM